VKVFREFLDEKESSKRDPDTIDAFNGRTDSEAAEDDTDGHDDNDVTDKVRKTPEKETDPDKFKRLLLSLSTWGSRALS
jgi:ParB family chromosome partitioning protein